MSRFVLVSGDQAIFLPNFGPATVRVRPGLLVGSGRATLSGVRVCVDGDEKTVVVPGCSYQLPGLDAGRGTLFIEGLAADQRALRMLTAGKPVLMVGTLFIAKFVVQEKARKGQFIDPYAQHAGAGYFVASNRRVRAL